MKINKVSTSWYIAQGVCRGRHCVGYGRTFSEAMGECLQEMYWGTLKA